MNAHGPEHGAGDDKGWADSKAFRRGFLAFLVIVSLIAAGLGFLPAAQKEHPHFNVEGIPVFFAIYGFVMFSLIVLVGQHLRKIVGRDERYYDERE